MLLSKVGLPEKSDDDFQIFGFYGLVNEKKIGFNIELLTFYFTKLRTLN